MYAPSSIPTDYSTMIITQPIGSSNSLVILSHHSYEFTPKTCILDCVITTKLISLIEYAI